MTKRGTTAFRAVLALALLMSDSGNADDEEYPVTVLSKYRTRYDRIRTTLAESASHLSQKNPDHNVCSRTMNPPLKVADHETDYDEKHDEATDNAELMMESDLTSPGVPESRDAPTSLNRYTVLPGFLARDLRITGPKGPLDSNAFKIGPHYGDEIHPFDKDPGRRLAKNLDAGLRVRYVIELRVTKNTPPDVKSVPKKGRIGSIHSRTSHSEPVPHRPETE
ncbi:hypothetical protein ABZ250_39415 [Streptomyces afghaniensis]|uniref:hypothetical protein n=1 Tax=Streptomyces afghaniensis TaxID=66865 RepID=UPI0033B1EBEF